VEVSYQCSGGFCRSLGLLPGLSRYRLRAPVFSKDRTPLKRDERHADPCSGRACRLFLPVTRRSKSQRQPGTDSPNTRRVTTQAARSSVMPVSDRNRFTAAARYSGAFTLRRCDARLPSLSHDREEFIRSRLRDPFDMAVRKAEASAAVVDSRLAHDDLRGGLLD
jgi:hypothetical protein